MDPSSLFGWYIRLELLKIKIIDSTVFVRHKGYLWYIHLNTDFSGYSWKIDDDDERLENLSLIG